jgi:hypothetical protein
MLQWICDTLPSHGVKPTWRFHKVKLRKVETWRHAPGFQLWKGVEGRVGSPWIKLGRGISWSSLNLYQNKPPKWLVHIPGHLLVLGQATGTSDHKTHHGPDSREATTFPHIVFSMPLRRDYIQMALFSGTPQVGVPKSTKVSRFWTPGTLGRHRSSPWTLIATRSKPKL